MNLRKIAKKMGRKGGLARAKRLSAEQRIKIASLGGQVKALSAKAEQRIEKNYIYVKIVKELQKPPKPKSISRISHSLPGIYANGK